MSRIENSVSVYRRYTQYLPFELAAAAYAYGLTIVFVTNTERRAATGRRLFHDALLKASERLDVERTPGKFYSVNANDGLRGTVPAVVIFDDWRNVSDETFNEFASPITGKDRPICYAIA